MNPVNNDTSNMHLNVVTSLEMYAHLQMKGPNFLMMPIEIISKLLNATWEVILTDVEYEELLPNGSWTGEIGMLQRGEADMSLDLYIAASKRLNAVEYVFKTPFTTEIHVVSKTERASSIRDIWDNFQFVQWQVYFMYLFTIVSVCATAVLLHRAADKEREPRTLKRLVLGYLFGCMDIAFTQGNLSMKKTRPFCLKLIFWFFAVGAFLLEQIFLSRLQTGLVVDAKADVIDSAEDLIAKPELEVMIPKYPVFVELYQKPVTETEREIGKMIGEGDDNHMDPSCEGQKLTRLIRGTHVFLAMKILVVECGELFCNNYRDIQVHVSKRSVIEGLVYPVLSKHMKPDLKDRMEDIYQRMFENGLYDYWLKTYHSQLPSCVDESPLMKPVVEAENDDWIKPKLVKNSLKFLFVGYSVAGATLFIELLQAVGDKLAGRLFPKRKSDAEH